MRKKGSRIGHREKSSCHAGPTLASAGPTRSSGAQKTHQSSPALQERHSTYFCLNQSYDRGSPEAIPEGAGHWKPLLTALPVARATSPFLKGTIDGTSLCHHRTKLRASDIISISV